MKTALDLCCGRGGWAQGLLAEGWRVIGIDLADFSKVYPGEFVQGNLLAWEGWRTSGASLVVASPPCEEFSRHGMPWTRARNPPEPSLTLIDRCRFIASELKAPFILENVRSAQPWLGVRGSTSGRSTCGAMCPQSCHRFTERKKKATAPNNATCAP